MIKFVVATILTVQAASSETKEKPDKCYALAMSGGGSNGAWEAGLVWGLAHYGKPEDFYWDVLTGASAGSINSAMMTPWAPNEVV